MLTCELCREQLPPGDVLDHIRVMHPDDYEAPQTWPDGSLVIEDHTLTPEDFLGDPCSDCGAAEGACNCETYRRRRYDEHGGDE